MSNAKNLTDAELRRELKALGSNAGPITSSTRALYEKKLEQLRSAKVTSAGKASSSSHDVNGNHSAHQKQIKPTPRRKKFGFSSDESDNNEGRKNTSKMLATRRQHKSNKKISNLRSKSIPQKVDSETGRRLTRSSAATLSPLVVKNGYSDDSSDSENSSQGSWIQVQSADTNTSPGLIGSSPFASAKARRSLSNRSSLHNSPLLADDTFKDPSRHESQDAVNSAIGSDTSPQTADGSSSKIVYSFRKETRNGGDNFRRRALSHAMRQTAPNAASNGDQASADSTAAATLQTPIPKLTLFSRLFSHFRRKKVSSDKLDAFSHSEEVSPRSWSLHCSVLLPICTIVFFTILGLLYVTMRSDDVGSITGPPLLDSSITQVQHERNQTMAIVNRIYDVLGTVAGQVTCNITSESEIMSTGRLKSRMEVNDQLFLKALGLIRDHPEWEIFLYKNSKGLELLDTDSLRLVRFMEAKRPILPTFCRFQRAVEKVLFRVSLVLLVGLVIWLVILYRRYRTRKMEEERREMFLMVEKILDLLKKHHSNCSTDDKVEPFVPILHARDMLIPAQERQSRAKEWSQAVKFISASESRIRVETQRVAGEDYRVWRWIQVTSPSKRQQPPGRVWQGEAFDTNRSINAPNISPTPCLKIRNMFDPDVEKDEDWVSQVQDSILEKCSDNNEILSIVVEKKSREGLVYVKCSSCSGAGKAFKALHGSWFDGRLVTVKFIKLQRFHFRYPGTVDQTTPLKPSSDVPVSTFLPPDEPPSGFLTSTPLKSNA